MRLTCAVAPCPCDMIQILVGNKLDLADEKRAVPIERGQALADEFGFRFFETSAKEDTNVEQVRWLAAPRRCRQLLCTWDPECMGRIGVPWVCARSGRGRCLKAGAVGRVPRVHARPLARHDALWAMPPARHGAR